MNAQLTLPVPVEPVCSRCREWFAWAEDADRCDEGPLFCNPCAQAIAAERQKLWRLLKLFAYRARYLQLLHSCPSASEEAARNKWNRKIRWAERRVLELGGKS